MHRIIFTSILLIACRFAVYGQATPPSARDTDDMLVVDSMRIRISYAFNAAHIKDNKTYDDLQRLEIGARLSKYYSFFVYNSDSLVTDWRKKHPKASSKPYRMGIQGKDPDWSEYYYSEYYKIYH